jgi:hypothetical protein
MVKPVWSPANRFLRLFIKVFHLAMLTRKRLIVNGAVVNVAADYFSEFAISVVDLRYKI